MPKLMKTDWKAVAKQELIPEGKVSARLDKVEERTAKESQNPYWNFEFTLTGPEEVVGRKVWDVFMLDTKSLWKLRNFCECIGIELEGQRDLDTDELMGQDVGLQIAHEVYESRTRNRVKGYFALEA